MSWTRIVKIFAVIAAVAAPAAAYEIGSGIPVPKRYWNLHETFTTIAGECVRPNGGVPSDCSSRFAEVKGRARRRQARPENIDSYASRWPDDPMRLLDGAWRAKAGYGLQFKACKNAFKGGASENASIDQAGLLCSSHFGQLQFLHAQSRPQDREENTSKDHRDPAITRRNILAWARFAYRAATDPTFRDRNYCQAVAEIQEARVETALRFADVDRCRDRTVNGKEGPVRYLEWRVGTLFGQRCKYLWVESFCWDQTEPFDDETARYGARGAILHLIQDSYSQSHAARLPVGEGGPEPLGPFTARVVCLPPLAYYDYSQQNKRHEDADVRPRLHSSCNDPASRTVDDVITASAVALYYLDNPDLGRFETYLATRVFPPAP
jgi:hypothetical protein